LPGSDQAVGAGRGGGIAAEPPLERGPLELDAMLQTAHLMAHAALLREESRGAHYRTDFPETDPAWLKVIVQRSTD
jgi:succinate dehydrogenase/fumarate reductase flavoprotein subunit